MTSETLAAALEREHREIDHGVDAFVVARRQGRTEVEALTGAVEALRRHIFLEEEFLFPPLREAGMVAPIFVMLREHGDIWNTMEALRAELARDPAGASVSDACRRLLEQLERHNAKEEPILYPHADTTLGDGARARLRAFLKAGRMPEGWVCARAAG